MEKNAVYAQRDDLELPDKLSVWCIDRIGGFSNLGGRT
jgi:hypothetical protein